MFSPRKPISSGPPPFGAHPQHPLSHMYFRPPPRVPPPGMMPSDPRPPFPPPPFIGPPPREMFGGPQRTFPIDPAPPLRGAQPSHPEPPPAARWKPISNAPSLDNSEKASEEFLRCIATNKPLPNYLKGDMEYNLADAIKSANALKEAVKSDPEVQKLTAVKRSRSRSRGRSCGRSRGRSRGKSRAKSCPRGKSKGRRSRSRSSSRDKHCRERAKSCARSKSRMRSRSRSSSRSRKKSRAKSRSRKSRSRSRSSERSHMKDKKKKKSPSPKYGKLLNSGGKVKAEEKALFNVITHKAPAVLSAESTLLEGLRKVINSKELENKIPSLKDTLLTAQPPKHPEKERLHKPVVDPLTEASMVSLFSDNDSLLPHERVGCDFSWIQTQTQEDLIIQKAHEVEDEESFLYGNDDSASANPPAYPSYPKLVNAEFDKIRNILKSVSSNEEAKVKPAQQTVPPAVSDPAVYSLPTLSNPNVRQALESLQSLIKATKEKRVQEKGDREDSMSSQSSGKNKMNAGDKQARKTKMEFLMKELEGLLKQDGLGFLTPVIGFYCHKCEEFIGDLNTAEKHAAAHQLSSNPQGDKHSGNGKPHSNQTDQTDSKNHGQHQRKEEKVTANPGGNLSLKEKLQEERLLITVSCGESANQNARIKQEHDHKRDREESSSRSRSRSSRSISGDEPREKKAHKKKKKKSKKKKKNKK